MQKKLEKLFGKSLKLTLFIFFTIIWSLFVYLIKGEWLYFVPIILADVLFFETISWQFWKKKEKKKKQKKSEFKSWIDAILFAVIAATLLRTFLIEAYTIPTPSMEKSMLVGDFLFVSKVAYGPRVPMTPLAVPLVHHTIPILGLKSYSEALKIPYHRMKGLGEVKRNDCVVFNWPAEELGRPIDKKENYVKRCVGIPGDTIKINNSFLYVNNKPQDSVFGMKKQWSYRVEMKGNASLNKKILYEKYDITEVRRYGKDWILNLTDFNLNEISKFKNIKKITKLISESENDHRIMFPQDKKYKWNSDNFGPLVIPKKGEYIQLNSNNIAIYKTVIERYERNTLKVEGDSIFINNILTNKYKFKMNYFWMMGDNRHNSADSRMWGFVPENHIVGKALFVWMSWDKNAKGLKKIRWNRLFTSVK